jgi:hypothetical protein
MKTLIFTKIIFTNSAFLVTPNIKMLHTFIIKAVLNETHETIMLTKTLDKVNNLINLHFGMNYDVKFNVDESMQESYNIDYKEIVVTALSNLSSRYH